MAQEKCIKELLEQETEDAKVGEFLKQAQTKLEELAKGVDAEEQNYRDKMPELLATWQEHEHRVNDLESQIKTCYPQWKEYLDKVICDEVIQNIRDLREKIKDNIGEPEWKLNRANEVRDAAAQQLDAWKNITKWIKARLDANALLIEEICKFDSCKERKDRLCAIYIFFFELLPAHKQLEKPLDELPHEHKNPEEHWCSECGDYHKPDSKLYGFPWLIAPNKYDCTLAKIWKTWLEAGKAQVKAQCEYDAILACRAELLVAIDPVNKRKNACAALRAYAEGHECGAKSSSNSD